ncbi:M48 family metallopeptidase [Lichenicola sp.]|uniref:M48 family metallopeptidase n=1 Tax=Lichenicola sp. TaxID=2804529 RepID=UPI003B010034
MRRPLQAAQPEARGASPSMQQELLWLPAGETPVRWHRCRRARRISLRIDPRAGMVVVTLPPRAGREAGLALLRTHSNWVADRLAALPTVVTFAEGATIPFIGEPHVIRHVPDARRGVWIEAGEIRISGERAFLPRRLADFLRAEARLRLARLAHGIGTAPEAGTGLLPSRLAIKDTSTRWGSCSSEGVVMFSWRLVMAPPEIQHYVVAHELAHLRHLDHGAGFWTLVDRLTPHRAHAERWLRQHGPTLLRTG